MIDGVVELCREHSEVFKRGWLFVLEEKTNAHADEITVSWLIRILLQGTKAIFIVFRENYAHYASLAKKMGNPIDPFLKSGQLTYIECFNTQWCSQLPLMQSSPVCYISPPTSVHRVSTYKLMEQPQLFVKESVVMVDAVSYLEERPEVCFWIYQQAAHNRSQIVLGGCEEASRLTNVFTAEADAVIRMENDVSAHGKFTVTIGNWCVSLLWSVQNGKIEVCQHIKI